MLSCNEDTSTHRQTESQSLSLSLSLLPLIISSQSSLISRIKPQLCAPIPTNGDDAVMDARHNLTALAEHLLSLPACCM